MTKPNQRLRNSEPEPKSISKLTQHRRFTRQVAICNQIALFAIIATVCYQITYLVIDPTHYSAIIVVNLLFMLVYAFGIGLNAKRRHVYARNLVVLTTGCQLFVVSLFIGSEAGVHLFYFALGCLLPFLYYPIRPTRYIGHMSLLTLAFLVSHFAFNRQNALSPVPESIVDMLYTGSVIGVVSLIALTLYLFGKSIEESEQQLTQLSSTDDMTGLANRRTMDAYLATIWGLAQRRDRRPLSLLLCDVDHFKKYNDAHGHPAGDQCLKKVAQEIESIVRRQADLVTRYGGEEFIIILPNTAVHNAQAIAEHIRHAIEALNLMNQGLTPPAPVTISIGAAAVNDFTGITREKLIKMADDALYAAKDKGRNRVETATEES